MIIILILSLVLRLISLNQSLWLDEATTALVSRMSLTDIFTKFMPGDFHPPLYYLVLKGWTDLFGYSEISLRAPSIIFGIGTVYLIYLIGKKLFDKNTGLIAGALLATSGLSVYYSQEARMYAFSAFLATLTFFSFVKILKRGRLGDWMLFSLSLAALCMSDYLPNAILLVFWLLAWGQRKNKLWIKKFIASHIILAVSWLWWLPYFLKQLESGLRVSSNSPAWWNILGKFSFKEIALIPTKFLIGRINLDDKILYAIFVLLLLSLFGFLIIKSIKQSRKIILIYLWLGVPLILTILLSLKIPVLTYFRLLFILPAFYFLVAVGVGTLKDSYKRIMLCIVLIFNLASCGYYLYSPKFQREDWRGLVSFIQSQSKDSSAQTIFPSRGQMEGYNYYSSQKPSTIGEIDAKSDIIWLVRYVWEISDPKDITRAAIEDMKYKKTNEYDFNGIIVYKYEKN